MTPLHFPKPIHAEKQRDKIQSIQFCHKNISRSTCYSESYSEPCYNSSTNSNKKGGV